MAPRKIHKKRPTNSKRKPQSHVAPLSALLVGAALLSLGVGLANRIVLTQKRLETMQSKLHKVSEDAIQARATAAGFQEAAHSLKKQLEDERQSSNRAVADTAGVRKQVTDLKSELNHINANRDLLHAELNLALSEITHLRTRLRAAEAQGLEMQSRLKAVQSDLEASKQATVQAETKAIELGEQAIQLQSDLKLGRAEREALRKELNQAQVSLEAKPPLSKRGYSHLSIDSEARDYLIRTIVFEGEGETEMAKPL